MKVLEEGRRRTFCILLVFPQLASLSMS